MEDNSSLLNGAELQDAKHTRSESKITTVSADARLMPRPPARVDNRKQKSWAHKWRISSIRTIWEKMSTRWPRSFSRTSSLSSRTSFPLLRISCCREGNHYCSVLPEDERTSTGTRLMW
ncbi:hypothetical protein EYF80_044757 [Liparis tanakae]|uniref:Uncharacterized protein n=1 Tax=Liparis tanakae TaxID=230148 RepID=A0A4Z2FVQ3_9TELE|nr:hypothetical protein EYF80_044757 [Liparis tanakae]